MNDIARSWPCEEGHSRYAAVNSYGYGGINIFLVIKEAPEQKVNTACKDKNLFILTAQTEVSMEKNINAFIKFLEDTPSVNLTQLCANLSTRRRVLADYRLAIVCDSSEDILNKLKAFQFRSDEERQIYYAANTCKDKKRKAKYIIRPEDNLQQIAKEFCDGKDCKFSCLYEDYPISYIKLPGYVFERKSYWSEDFTKSKFKKLFCRLLPPKEDTEQMRVFRQRSICILCMEEIYA